MDLDAIKIEQSDYLQMIVDRDVSIALLQKQMRALIDHYNVVESERDELKAKYESVQKEVPGIVDPVKE